MSAAQQRREAIIQTLTRADGPCSASALAGQLGVSRQVIVGDIALLRAAGQQIIATPRGYVLNRSDGLLCTVACRHEAADMGRELYAMVDQGCTVLDVIVDHPVYGQLTGQLQCSSRHDVDIFLSLALHAQPLSALTRGIHLHTLRCPDEAAYRRVLAALDALDFLVSE